MRLVERSWEDSEKFRKEIKPNLAKTSADETVTSMELARSWEELGGVSKELARSWEVLVRS